MVSSSISPLSYSLILISSLVTVSALANSFFLDLVTWGAWKGGNSGFFSVITGVTILGSGESTVVRLVMTGGLLVDLAGVLATGFAGSFFLVITGFLVPGLPGFLTMGESDVGMFLLF